MPFKEFDVWYKNQIKICHYCGIPEEVWQHLFIISNNNRKIPRRLTIDRLDSSIKYVNGNIVLACYYCNFLKGQIFSEEEALEICQKYIKPKWQAKLLVEAQEAPIQNKENFYGRQ